MVTHVANNRTIEYALGYAAASIEQGNLTMGKIAFEWILKREPDNSLAWLWMANCVQKESQKTTH